MFDGVITPIEGIDFNATGVVPPDNQVWDLDYCCEDHYCISSAVRRWEGGWLASVGLGLVIALAMV